MAHVPYIDEILDIVKGKKSSEVRGLISILADIILITTGRQAHRMFFPINFLYKAHNLRVDEDGNIITTREVTNLRGGDTLLRWFNMSGNGGMYLYNMCSGLEFELEGSWNAIAAQQITFHCIVGT